MINNIFNDDIFNDDINDDVIKYYYIDINKLKNKLTNIINYLDSLPIPNYSSNNLNSLIKLLFKYKTGEDIFNDSINNKIKLNGTIELNFTDNLNELLILLSELFTLLKQYNINIYIKKLSICSLKTNHKLNDFNNVFKYLNLKLFDNISYDVLHILGFHLTDFKYIPDNINTIQFTSCNIQKCDNFPVNVKNVNFNYTPLPNNFSGFPENLTCLNLIIGDMTKYKFYYTNSVSLAKKIIKEYIGNLYNLPYNLKIKECNIINTDYSDSFKVFIKQYIKEKLKEHYKQDNLYKKLYRQLVSYKKL